MSRRGFTLVELMVVILIIALVSVLTLPVVIPAFSHRQVSEAARILQGTLVGARDRAIHLNRPCGIRLLPDQALLAVQPALLPNGQPNPQAGWPDFTQPVVFNRIVPIDGAPEYNEGMVSIYPGKAYPAAVTQGLPVLVLEQAVTTAQGAPNSPTSWMWNIRVGDKVQVGNAGPWYTVIGPETVPNPEQFINVGPPGPPPVPEYLVLVDGQDDNGNGWIDEGADGIDNDRDGFVDNNPEWVETETWGGSIGSAPIVSAPYAIRRRPLPGANAGEVALPAQVVVDFSRSMLPVNLQTACVDLIIAPDGTASPSLPYSTPASMAMSSAFFGFWLSERADIGTGVNPKGQWAGVVINARTGALSTSVNPPPATPFLGAMQGNP